jgi:hypothetical protein
MFMLSVIFVTVHGHFDIVFYTCIVVRDIIIKRGDGDCDLINRFNHRHIFVPVPSPCSPHLDFHWPVSGDYLCSIIETRRN